MLSKAECATLLGYVCLMHGKRLLTHAYVHSVLRVFFAEHDSLRVRTSYNFTLIDNTGPVSEVTRGHQDGYDVRQLAGVFDASDLDREAAVVLSHLAITIGSTCTVDGSVMLCEYTNVHADAHAELRARSEGLGYLFHHAYMLHCELK